MRVALLVVLFFTVLDAGSGLAQHQLDLLALGFRSSFLALAAALSATLYQHGKRQERALQRNVVKLEMVNADLTWSYDATLRALGTALDARDMATEEHSQRVRYHAEQIARRLGVSDRDLRIISQGALLHDLGKIGVPDAILRKPGRLTAEEQLLMRQHPLIGYRMIADIPFLAEAAPIVLHHHESFDGTGYPFGLEGVRIPLGARIFAVADALDATTSDRPYRQARSLTAALAEVVRCRGTQFDPGVVDALLAIPRQALLTSPAPARIDREVAASFRLDLTRPAPQRLSAISDSLAARVG